MYLMYCCDRYFSLHQSIVLLSLILEFPMQPLLKRIALHGLLTAVVLLVIGYGLAELASIWLAGQPVVRQTNAPVLAPVNEPISNTINTRLPWMMALWGFVFVALVESVVSIIRRHRTIHIRSIVPSSPDPAELLLEELLAQVDAKNQSTLSKSTVLPLPPSTSSQSSDNRPDADDGVPH